MIYWSKHEKIIFMFKIVRKNILATQISLFEIDAPEISRKCQAGQFVILHLHEKAERIPVTIAGFDRSKGTIKVVIQEAGKSTKEITSLNEGEGILDVAGPLGRPTKIMNYGCTVFVGGGYGTAAALPVIQKLKEEGNEVIVIIGARTKELVIMENEVKNIADKVLVSTDDGSYGYKGFVTDVLRKLIEEDKKEINFIVAVGPVPMMKAVSELTRPHKIKTVVSLNPIMLDATGMCGVCRVTVGGKTKFACVDGPDFDGHVVDFEELEERRSFYKIEEKVALEKYEHKCSFY